MIGAAKPKTPGFKKIWRWMLRLLIPSILLSVVCTWLIVHHKPGWYRPVELDEADSPRRELAEERLEAFRTRADGFELAEEDLRLRGEGETIGARQSGFLPFRLRHPREDLAALAELRRRVTHGGSGAEDPIWARLEPFFASGTPPPERRA